MIYYYFIIALQAYCIYHCFTKRNNYYWYFIIFFIPLLGCLGYLFTQVFQEKDIDKAQKSIIAIVNPGKKIADLEKKIKFSNTFGNRVALADAYLESQFYVKAIENYKGALNKGFQKDFYTMAKLVEAYYYSSLYKEVISCAEKIKSDSKFKKSKALFFYGLSLEQIDEILLAEEILLKFDAPFSNYQERLVLAQFFIRNNKIEKAKVLLNEMIAESDQMTKQTIKNTREIIRKVKEELSLLK